jgi:hypothetical protein
MLLSTRRTAFLVNSCFSKTAKGNIINGWVGSPDNSSVSDQIQTEYAMFKQAGENTGNSVIGHSMNKALVAAGFKLIGNYPALPNSEKEWVDFLEKSKNSNFIVLCLQDLIRPDANQVWGDAFFSNLERLSEACPPPEGYAL